MWSLGCVLVELYTARPVFAGRDSVEQLYAIMDVLGPPPPALLSEASFLRRYFRLDARDNTLHPKKRYRWRGMHLEHLIAQGSKGDDAEFLPDFVDLIARMLAYDPAQRLTPMQALQHAFIVAGPATRRPGAPPPSHAPPPTVQLPPPLRNPFAVTDYGPYGAPEHEHARHAMHFTPSHSNPQSTTASSSSSSASSYGAGYHAPPSTAAFAARAFSAASLAHPGDAATASQPPSHRL